MEKVHEGERNTDDNHEMQSGSKVYGKIPMKMNDQGYGDPKNWETNRLQLYSE